MASIIINHHLNGVVVREQVNDFERVLDNTDSRELFTVISSFI
jgi:hypothetical protein